VTDDVSRSGTVYLNGRFLSQPLTGVQRVASELVSSLDSLVDDRIADSIRFVLLTPRGVRRTLKLENIPVRQVGRLSGYAWEQLELPWYSRKGRLLSFCNIGPVFHRRQIVMIHDTLVFAMPENFSRSFVYFYQTILPLLGRRSLAVLTVSEFSKKQLSRFGVVDDKKLFVVPNGADHILRTSSDVEVLDQYGLQPNRYVLAVGTDKRSKNFDLLRESASELGRRGLRIAIAGGRNKSVFGQFKEAGGVDSKVTYCTELNDSRLRALYENAFCLVIPSFYEGFGLPAAEAMFCKCPVIASSLASLPEICGEAALYCDPNRKNTLLEQIDILTNDSQLRCDLVERGEKQVSRMTWKHSADRLVQNLVAA
jgi:glycosyltransferase involved in cell wall biosynthesis